jgi:hypothetical protein
MADNRPACSPVQAPVQGEAPRLGLLLVAATLLAVPFVLFSTFSGMSWYDDEGTLLVGFRSLLDGHRMYDDIFSLYGPLYNAVYGLVYVVLGIPLTHTAGRLIAAALWLSYTAGFAVFCHRLTRSMATMLFGYLLGLVWLAQLVESPGHPEEICLLLLATVLLLACSIERVPNAAALTGIGTAVAGLALVKINMGAYVGGGLVLALLRVTAPTAWTRIAIAVMTIALLLLPFAVQALLFDFRWVRLYSLFSALAIGAALLVYLNIPQQAILRSRDWWIIALAGILTCLVVIGGMMVAGSSAHAILNAALLQNAHFIRNWYEPLYVRPQGMLAAIASILTALAYRMSGSRPHMRDYRDLGILALKSGFVLLGVVLLHPERLALGVYASPSTVFRILVPFCWLLMVPIGIQRQHVLARGVAGLIGAIMSLYPFPVAGDDQINIGTLLPVIMVPVLAHDVLTVLYRHEGGRRLLASRSAFLAVMAALIIGAAFTLRSARAYWHNVPLGLPGTSLIRVDQKQAGDLRWVTAELSSCVSSYSMPGLLSFAFWTGHALPTTLNINDVLAFIRPAQQQSIVEGLSHQSGLCVVYNPEYLQVFDRGQIETDPPLLHYLHTEFVPTAERDGYIILKRRTSVP